MLLGRFSATTARQIVWSPQTERRQSPIQSYSLVRSGETTIQLDPILPEIELQVYWMES